MAEKDRQLRRHNSEVNIRDAFPPSINTELLDLEGELKKIQDELNTSDKRHLGSVIGAGVFGVLGFILLIPTPIGGIVGGLVGLGVGHLVGRSLRKRRKDTHLNFNMDKLYQLRLSCLLRLLERKMKAKTPLDTFLRIIERVVSEFRPALVLELHNPKLGKIVDDLIKVLRKDVCHTALLNGVSELNQLLNSNSSITLFITRLKYFFIPVMELLRQPSKNRAQLEVVMSIERLVQKKSVQELLAKHSKEVEAVLANVLPRSDSNSILCLSPEFSRAAAKVDEALEGSDDVKMNDMMLRRCVSLQDDAPIRSKYKQQVESLVIKTMKNAYMDSTCPPEDLPVVQEVEEDKTPHPESGRQVSRFLLRPMTPPGIIKGTTNELMESSGDDDQQPASPLIPDGPIELDQVQPVVEDKPPEATMIELKIHQYQPDFDELLLLEAEQSNGKVWQQVVNKPGVQVFKKKTEGTPICMIKAFCDIQYSKEVVFKAIWDTTVRSRWDEVFEEFRTIDVQPDYDVLYYMIKVELICRLPLP